MLTFFRHAMQTTEKRYKRTVVIGYGVPALIILATIITEFTADRCMSIRPRFDEKGCFFASKYAS